MNTENDVPEIKGNFNIKSNQDNEPIVTPISNSLSTQEAIHINKVYPPTINETNTSPISFSLNQDSKSSNSVSRNTSNDEFNENKEVVDKILTYYASHLAEKVNLYGKYVKEIQELQKILTNGETKNEDKENEKYNKLLNEYKEFTEKKKKIDDDYKEKLKLAQDNENSELENKINQAQNDALSKLAIDELMASADWSKLFNGLSNLGLKEINKLYEQIKEQKAELEIDLNPADQKKFDDKVADLNKELKTRNPFQLLVNGIKEYSEAEENLEKKAALKKIFEGTASSLNLVKGSFDSITSGMKEMGWAGDKITQELLGDISKMAGGAAEVATGLATGNPLTIIQGSITMLTSVLKVFNVQDRQAERQIKQHKKNLEELEKTYKELEKAIDKALEEDRYSTKKESIDNLKAQKKELEAIKDLEDNKKKKDKEKIKEYEKSIQQMGEQIEKIIQKMREDILGTTVSSAANDLGNAIINAFAAGEDAAGAWGKKVDEIVGNVIKKMLIQKLVEQPVGQILNRYMEKWIDKDGNFIGIDSVMSSALNMDNELKGLSSGITAALEGLPDDIKKFLIGDDMANVSNNSLKGAVKGVTEETASLVEGQMNAIRINQMEASELVKEQLFILTQIAHNTSYNYYLKNIDKRLESLYSLPDPLRAQGLA